MESSFKYAPHIGDRAICPEQVHVFTCMGSSIHQNWAHRWEEVLKLNTHNKIYSGEVVVDSDYIWLRQTKTRFR